MKSVLILGNGISRLQFNRQILCYPGEVWGCNNVFLEYGEKLTLLTGHVENMEMAEHEKRINENCKYEIYSGAIKEKYDIYKKIYPNWKRFNCPEKYHKDSGSTLVNEALFLGYERIDICGFDLGGKDIFCPKHDDDLKHNWVKRWCIIASEYGLEKIHFWGWDHKPYIMSCIDGKATIFDYSGKYRKGLPHIPDINYISIHDCFEKRGR